MKHKMTVGEMIEELKRFDPKTEVIIWDDQYLKYPHTFTHKKIVYGGRRSDEPYLFREEDEKKEWYKDWKRGEAILID